MALTRRFLTALGIDADKIDEIISAHTDSLEGIKADRDRYKAESERLVDIEKQFNDYKKDHNESTDAAKIQKEFDDFKDKVAKEKATSVKRDAYKKLLALAKVNDKRVDAILRLADLDKIEIGEDGKVKDESKVLDSIKNEWSDYIVNENTNGSNTNDPPPDGGGNAGDKDDPDKMSYEEYKIWRNKQNT